MKNYSYNSGKPIAKIIVPTLGQAVSLILMLQNSGKVFRADFTKRTDGTKRTMVCRCGVKKYLKGGSPAYNFSKKGLISVFEFGKGYRSIPLDNLIAIKYGGVAYLFNVNLEPGEYRFLSYDRNRTLHAFTSPMYEEDATKNSLGIGQLN